MSVAETQPATRKNWQGFRESRYPIGAWQGNANVVGDSGGGTRTLTIVLQEGDLQSLAFSVERLMLTLSEDTAQAGLMRSGGFELGYDMAFRIENTGTVAATRADFWRRVFLGITARTAGTADISFIVSNVDAGIFIVQVEGYIWGPRSSQAPGGFQVPVTSPWSSA